MRVIKSILRRFFAPPLLIGLLVLAPLIGLPAPAAAPGAGALSGRAGASGAAGVSGPGGSDEMILENDYIKAAVKSENLELTILNKRNGYTWTHAVGSVQSLNNNWRGFANSGVSIETCVQERSVRQYSFTGKAELSGDGGGIRAELFFEDTGIGLAVEFLLEQDSLIVTVPFESIYETDDGYALQTVTVYPFLGASAGLANGYFIVPDGSGALIDLNRGSNAELPYQMPVYGDDIGFYGTTPLTRVGNIRAPYSVTVPAFGVCYEGGREGGSPGGPNNSAVGANAVICLLTGGAEQAVIKAYRAGIMTEYNWIAATFRYRDFYTQYASSAATSGAQVNQPSPNAIDAQARFFILDGDSACYGGMAVRLRDWLSETGVLAKHPVASGDLFASVLIADNKKALIGRSTIEATTALQAQSIADSLKLIAPGGLRMELSGYQSGGVTRQSPKLGRLQGGGDGWARLIGSFDNELDRLYFHRDYMRVYKGASGFWRGDLAQNASEQLAGMHNEKIMTITQFGSLSGRNFDYFQFLRPPSGEKIFDGDVARLNKLGAQNLSFDTMGQILNSMHGRNAMPRGQAAESYRALIGGQAQANGWRNALHNPNMYMWGASQTFFSMPATSTGYTIETRPVPFIPMILSGRAEMYAEYVNFQSGRQDYLMRILEYGMRPSYLLTWENPSLLIETDSRWIYSSQWSVWNDTIGQQAAFLSPGIEAVRGAAMSGHRRLAEGIYESEYDNGVKLIFNYGSTAYETGGRAVGPGGYMIVRQGDAA